MRVLDGFNPSEPLLEFLLRNGITIVHACPGRANVIGGMTGVFRTHGRTAEAMTIRFPHAMLFNLGEPPKDTYEGQRPGTQMGTAALIREALVAAANDARKRRSADAAEPHQRDLKYEALHQVLDRLVRAMFCVHRADDILTAPRLSQEFNLQPMLALVTEAYLIADQINGAAVPVAVHPTMQRVGGIETINSYLENAAVLSDRGVAVSIASGVEGYVPKTRVIRHEAAMVYSLGFSGALHAVTQDAAKTKPWVSTIVTVAGKAADGVLYDGDPFEHTTHATHVLMDGRPVYDRSKRSAIPLAERVRCSNSERPCCVLW